METHLSFLDGLAEGHLRNVMRVEAGRKIDGRVTTQTRYCLSNLAAPAVDFNRFIRPYWRIENSLHWQLEAVIREDRQRTHLNNGPLNLATVRKLVL